MVSNNRNKIHQTWKRPCGEALCIRSLLPSPDEEDGDASDEDEGTNDGGGGDCGNPAAALVIIVAALDAATVSEERGGVQRVPEGGLKVKKIYAD